MRLNPDAIYFVFGGTLFIRNPLSASSIFDGKMQHSWKYPIVVCVWGLQCVSMCETIILSNIVIISYTHLLDTLRWNFFCRLHAHQQTIILLGISATVSPSDVIPLAVMLKSE